MTTNSATTETNTTTENAPKKRGAKKGVKPTPRTFPDPVAQKRFGDRNILVFPMKENCFWFGVQLIQGIRHLQPEDKMIPIEMTGEIAKALADLYFGVVYKPNEYCLVRVDREDDAVEVRLHSASKREMEDDSKPRALPKLEYIELNSQDEADFLAEEMKKMANDRQLPAGSSDEIAAQQNEESAPTIETEEADEELAA